MHIYHPIHHKKPNIIIDLIKLHCVLISEPIGSLDSVIAVPSPVVFGHVAQSGIDASLSGHCVASGGEQLGDARSLETLFHQSESRAQSGSARSHHYCVISVVHYSVVSL